MFLFNLKKLSVIFLEWNDNDDMDDELNEQFIEWFDSNISQYIDFYLSDGDNSDD